MNGDPNDHECPLRFIPGHSGRHSAWIRVRDHPHIAISGAGSPAGVRRDVALAEENCNIRPPFGKKRRNPNYPITSMSKALSSQAPGTAPPLSPAAKKPRKPRSPPSQPAALRNGKVCSLCVTCRECRQNPEAICDLCRRCRVCRGPGAHQEWDGKGQFLC